MATSTNVTTPPTPTSVTTQPSTTISESDDLILHPQGPQRPGKPVCPFYKNNGRCGHRAVCVFHHPAELPPLEEPKKRKRREKKPKSLNYRTFTREEHLAYLKRIKETDVIRNPRIYYTFPKSKLANTYYPCLIEAAIEMEN
ncbi:hypothetical protein Vadar_032885 [Vaccinium darrowii]|uniref:Uncharacterized protein n=1 Tax=Vaccinium darrowii TaxID=229202 RepID=A0ACB7YHM5_9ERIC|nr:hypothetical protein Vadar_032885 [Vaccinium darrowii]